MDETAVVTFETDCFGVNGNRNKISFEAMRHTFLGFMFMDQKKQFKYSLLLC